MNSELEQAILDSSVPEELPKFDAKKVEDEMLEIAKNRAQDPSETAAMVYHMYRPEFLKRLPKLSARARVRVLEMLVQYPLNAEKVKFHSELEKEVYFFADSMIQAKFVLLMDQYKEAAQELVQAQDEFIFNKEEAEKLNKENETV
jgi:hypothetical protein